MAHNKTGSLIITRTAATSKAFKAPSKSAEANTRGPTVGLLPIQSNLPNQRTYKDRQRKRGHQHLSDSDDDQDKEVSSKKGTPVKNEEPVIEEPMFVPPPILEIPAELKSMFVRQHFLSPDDILPETSPPPEDLHGFQPPPVIGKNLLDFSPKIRKCPFCRQVLAASFTEKPPTIARAKYGYCRRHDNVTIIEEGKKQGYPSKIDFTGLRKRVLERLSVVNEVVKNPSESEYYKTLKKASGNRSVVQPMTMINVFDELQPGYYGPRGREIISDTVLKKMGDSIRKTDAIFEELRFCGGVTEFISSIVVPEIGVRLVMEDRGLKREEAVKVMRRSVPYGNIVNANGDTSDVEDSEQENDPEGESDDGDYFLDLGNCVASHRA
jgi:RTC4-like domain